LHTSEAGGSAEVHAVGTFRWAIGQRVPLLGRRGIARRTGSDVPAAKQWYTPVLPLVGEQ